MSYYPRHALVRAVRSLSTATKVAIATVATGGLLGAGAVAAISAGASTNGCVHGALAGSCGTQADAQTFPDGSPHPLYLAVGGKVASVRAGSLIIGTRPDGTRRVLDFYWYNPAGVPDNGKLAEYAPFGHRSGLCMAGHNTTQKVNLRPCNASFANQVWQFDGATNEWIDGNGAGSVLTLHFSGQPATVVPGPVTSPSTRQQFPTFATSTS
ncbi:MAG: hypothetical protein J2P30_00475 [Actinobacteria bacterium]|nr:hypothetical protein [Actinomycetota bacterium]